MRSLSASKSHSHAENYILTEIDGDPTAKALMHLGNVEIASMERHLARIVSK